jgi:hypothetical protein
MDMTRYGGDVYLRVEDIRESGPKRVKIEGVEDGQFDKPVAALRRDVAHVEQDQRRDSYPLLGSGIR